MAGREIETDKDGDKERLISETEVKKSEGFNERAMNCLKVCV